MKTKNDLKKGKKDLFEELDSPDGGWTQYYNEKLFTGTSIYFKYEGWDEEEYLDGWEEVNWVEGICHGEKKVFNKEGQLLVCMVKKRNPNTKYSSVISSKEYSESGNLIQEFFIGDQYLELKTWYENGEKKEIKNYNKEDRFIASIVRLDTDFTMVQHKKWNQKGELTQDINHSKTKITDKEAEKMLLLIDSNLSKNPFYMIVKKRGEVISRIPNIFTDTKLVIDQWSYGHTEEYKVRNESKEDSIFKYKNYLEIHNTINKHIQSNYIEKDDSKKLKELVCLRMSSYSSLDGIKNYLMNHHSLYELDGNKIY